MHDGQPPARDQLACDAAAYEAGLHSGSTADLPFEGQHPGLARTIRMLNTVFQPESPGPKRLAPPAGLTRIGRFRVNQCLGSGTFGSVWLADDPLLKRQVAIKVAHVGAHAHPELRERFEREAQLAARLYHPNIVPVFESGVDNGRLYIVTEYCRGLTLGDWLRKQSSPVSVDFAATVTLQLADAIAHAHRQGLIHRDIKPGNVLLSGTSGETSDDAPIPRLTDFGLARDLTSESGATRTGVLLGTIAYMSPEQATGNVAGQGPASDIFSLGILLYELMTGVKPFQGESDLDIIRQISSIDPPAPHRIRRGVPRDLSSICLKCLEKQPARRYATADELRDDLARFLRHESTVARPIHLAERTVRWARRAPTTATLVLATFFSLLLLAAATTFHQQQAQRQADDLASALRHLRTEQNYSLRALAEAKQQRRIARETSYRSDMRLAFERWGRGDIHQAANLLARQRPEDDEDVRGPEWYVLHAEYRAVYSEILKHPHDITEFQLTRNGRELYVTTSDHVEVVATESRKLLRIFEPMIGELHALALSPDERKIAVGGKPWRNDVAQVAVLDAATGERLSTLQTHNTTIESIAFSPDGKWLAAGSRYEPVQLTRLADGATFPLPATRRNRTVTFSSDSRFLTIAANDRNFELWRLDGDTPEKHGELSGAKEPDPYLVACAPNQSLLALGYHRQVQLDLYDPETLALQAVCSSSETHSRTALFTCIQFSPNGRWLAAGDDGGTIQLWDLHTRLPSAPDIRRSDPSVPLMPIAIWTPHLSRVSSIAVRDEGTVMSSGEDGRLVVLEPLRKGALHIRWPGLRVNASIVRGDQLAVGCEDGTLRIFRLDECDASPRVLEQQQLSSPPIPSIAFQLDHAVRILALSPDKTLIASGTAGGGVRLHRAPDLSIQRCLVTEQAGDEEHFINALAFSRDGRWLAHAADDGTATVHEVSTGECVLTHSSGSRGYAVAFWQEDQFVAFGGQFEGLRLVRISDQTLAQTLNVHNTYSLAVSDDGSKLASTHSSGIVRLIDASAGTSPVIVRGHRHFADCSAFTPDNRTLITADYSGSVLFTAASAGDVLGRWQLFERPGKPAGMELPKIHCSDGRLVITGWEKGPVSHLFVWHLSQD